MILRNILILVVSWIFLTFNYVFNQSDVTSLCCVKEPDFEENAVSGLLIKPVVYEGFWVWEIHGARIAYKTYRL